MSEYLGEYELTRHLATGGMAEIWIARQSGPAGFDRELAIKRILPHLAREERFISMFLDEARIASQLRHPNIVQIYELGESDGEYYIAMEYIEGGDLADLLDKAEEREIEIPIAMSVRIISDVLAALDYAHDFRDSGRAMHIVHRDVSPHNVLIGRDGIIKLVDFGIAHAVERHAKTETGLVKGKLSYMSPEQVEQEPLDRRADIFSVGCLFFELLTGKPPFGRELAAINGILNDDPPDPREARPEIPDELVPIIYRSLEKDPADRYQNALEMLEELEAVLRVFDKYVSAKHVAHFAHRLLNDLPIEGYDDVSQAIPRALSNRALAHADTAVDVPHPPDKPPIASTKESSMPVGPVVEETSGTQLSTAVRKALDIDAIPQTTRTPEPEEPTDDAPQESRIVWFAVPGAMLLLAAVGVTLGALSAGGDDANAEQQNDGEAVVIELGEQYVDVGLDYLEGDDGIYFDEHELHLVDLENWVQTMTPEEVEAMLDVNFEQSDAQYLWTVRGPALAKRFTDPPGRVNPGDPDAPKLLGLEELDESIVKPKKRTPRRIRRKRRKPRKRPAVAEKTVVQAERTGEETSRPKEEPAATKKPAEPTRKPTKPANRKTTKKPNKEKNDLQIIDRAVPY